MMKYYLFVPSGDSYDCVAYKTKESLDYALKTKCKDLGCIPFKTKADLQDLTLSKLAELYNVAAPEPVSKFADKPTAILRLLKVLGGSPGRVADEMVIHPLVKENYRRKGSKSYESFNLLKDGMSVKDFYKAGGLREDLLWDIRNNKVMVV